VTEPAAALPGVGVDRRAVEEWWESFRQACGVEADQHGTFTFDDSAELADELAGLVVRGPKRATAGLQLDYERDQEPVPRRATTRWWSTGVACRLP
jgi:hypothetical protein